MNILCRLSDQVDERTHPRNYQIFLLAIFATLSLGAVLSNANSERVLVAGISLPPICLFRLATGLDCPACGITRAVVLAFHGQWYASYFMHIWGIPLAALILLQIPYRLYRIWGGRELRFSPQTRKWATRIVVLSLAIPWLVKLGLQLH